MSKKELVKIDVEKIEFESIKILKANVNSINDESVNNEFDITISHTSGINISRKRMKFELTILIKGIDLDKKENGISGEFTIDFVFSYYEFEKMIINNSDEDNKTVISKGFTSTLLGLAYSTSRGIIFTRTLGTPLEGCTIPVINSMNLLDTLKKVKA